MTLKEIFTEIFLKMEAFDPQLLTKSQVFVHVLNHLDGKIVLKIQLINRHFYLKTVPDYFFKKDCPLKTQTKLGKI